MKILFLTHPYPNYVPDLLLHGLRKLLGSDVVDYPRKDCIYQGVLGLGVCPENQLCPDWFPSDDGQIDRSDIHAKSAKKFFDLVVCDIRSVDMLGDMNLCPSQRLALVDGEDQPFPIPTGPYVVCRRETDGSDFSVPLPMALPEELLNWIASYDHLEKKYSVGFLGSTMDGYRRKIAETIAESFPDALLQATAVPSEENPDPSGRLGRQEYYRQLQQCHFVLSLAGAGYDTFRFWENAACNAVHVAAQMPLFIPNDFIDKNHILRFSKLDHLKQMIADHLDHQEARQSIIRQGRHHLVNYHLTTHRALFFIDKMVRAYQDGPIRIDLSPKHSCSAVPTPASIEKTESDIVPYDLYLGLVEGSNYGWGVCSQYLIHELSNLVNCHVLNNKDGSDCNPALKGKLFQAITGIDFLPMFDKARGSENFGYTFFENELNSKSIENARQYDLVLGGSTWCRDRMLEKGIANCDVLIQGIDPNIFFPTDNSRNGDRFVIFSGGKFELRKGQDLVLRAVKILQDKYADIVLANCWYNIWPESMRWMAHSRFIEFEYKELPWQELMQSVYQANGLDSSRIKTFELVPNEMQRILYEQTDLGVFPNRCEGGTNLVMMEYMACGKPVVAANTTGQADIVTDQNALLLNHCPAYNIAGPGNELIARWQEPSLDELIEQIEYAYHHRDEIRQLGQRAGEDMQNYTWTHTARNFMRIVFDQPAN